MAQQPPAQMPPRVFISYSHDSVTHRERVLALANRLRDDDIESHVDLYVENDPPTSWPAWMEDQLEAADAVLVVCTKTYYRRYRNQEEEGRGRGATWEGAIIRQEMYASMMRSKKFIPILFDDVVEDHIPIPLRGTTRYQPENKDSYESLRRRFRSDPATPAPPVGKRPDLSQVPRAAGAARNEDIEQQLGLSVSYGLIGWMARVGSELGTPAADEDEYQHFYLDATRFSNGWPLVAGKGLLQRDVVGKIVDAVDGTFEFDGPQIIFVEGEEGQGRRTAIRQACWELRERCPIFWATEDASPIWNAVDARPPNSERCVIASDRMPDWLAERSAIPFGKDSRVTLVVPAQCAPDIRGLDSVTVPVGPPTAEDRQKLLVLLDIETPDDTQQEALRTVRMGFLDTMVHLVGGSSVKERMTKLMETLAPDPAARQAFEILCFATKHGTALPTGWLDDSIPGFRQILNHPNASRFITTWGREADTVATIASAVYAKEALAECEETSFLEFLIKHAAAQQVDLIRCIVRIASAWATGNQSHPKRTALLERVQDLILASEDGAALGAWHRTLDGAAREAFQKLVLALPLQDPALAMLQASILGESDLGGKSRACLHLCAYLEANPGAPSVVWERAISLTVGVGNPQYVGAVQSLFAACIQRVEGLLASSGEITALVRSYATVWNRIGVRDTLHAALTERFGTPADDPNVWAAVLAHADRLLPQDEADRQRCEVLHWLRSDADAARPAARPLWQHILGGRVLAPENREPLEQRAVEILPYRMCIGLIHSVPLLRTLCERQGADVTPLHSLRMKIQLARRLGDAGKVPSQSNREEADCLFKEILDVAWGPLHFAASWRYAQHLCHFPTPPWPFEQRGEDAKDAAAAKLSRVARAIAIIDAMKPRSEQDWTSKSSKELALAYAYWKGAECLTILDVEQRAGFPTHNGPGMTREELVELARNAFIRANKFGRGNSEVLRLQATFYLECVEILADSDNRWHIFKNAAGLLEQLMHTGNPTRNPGLVVDLAFAFVNSGDREKGRDAIEKAGGIEALRRCFPKLDPLRRRLEVVWIALHGPNASGLCQ